ncbi:hypothetical protein GCM10025868_34280 [Angustibacter aerolatus]|uniref:Uncharacterized protein n=1 Tax=Angustibacter aerolatus TaxID=1162965 RepID=A0ABQ6JJK6_9ACTN|nr:hypothetical protein GCM10025868_34280 [Angustibacter aerolatus]
MRASVCSTESCRCAATSARCWLSNRSRRSSSSLAHQPPQERADHQAEPDEDDEQQQERLAQRVEAPAADEEGDQRQHHEGDTADDARHHERLRRQRGRRQRRQPLTAGSGLQPAGALGDVGLHPQQRQAGGGDEHRHDDPERQPGAHRAEQQHQADAERPERREPDRGRRGRP